jgi:hypothetical protein
MRRISPFHSATGLVAWLFLGEAVLGYLHLGEFAFRLFGDGLRFLETHFFWDLGIGLGLLVLHVEWPKIKARIHPALRFHTIHDHLHDIRECHKKSLEDAESCFKGIWKRLDNIQETSDLKIANVEKKIAKDDERFQSLLKRFALNLVELQTLIAQSQSLTHDYEYIVNEFTQSDLSRRPFSNSWLANADEPAALGRQWRYQVKTHMSELNAFCVRMGSPMTTGWNLQENSPLYSWAAVQHKGNDSVTGAECVEMLNRHTGILTNARVAYATAFALDPLAKLTIS